MRVRHGEGVASYTGPESCACGREAASEALIGVHRGDPSPPKPINRNQIGFIELAYLVAVLWPQTEARPHPDYWHSGTMEIPG